MKVFLDPFGREDFGLILIVPFKTGVIYQNQCGGVSCTQNSLEGFIVPLGRKETESKIYDFFKREFGEHCYTPHNSFTENRIIELDSLLSEIKFEINDIEYKLSLDKSRISECVEAWIPVVSDYGKAILALRNSD